jgi:hypothetical protein
MKENFKGWPQHWQEHPDHSTKELEHRFTNLENMADANKEDHTSLHLIVTKHAEKLTFHERVLIALSISIGTLLQDRFPAIAAAIKVLIAGK